MVNEQEHMSQPEVRLTILIPAFNEEGCIAATVAELKQKAEKWLGNRFEILVVDDGSTDETIGQAKAAGARVLARRPNAGKGAALRAGVEVARGHGVVFTDADLAFSADQVLSVANKVLEGAPMVVGNRRLSEDQASSTPKVRRLGSRLLNELSSFLVSGQYSDMQCGLKGFDPEVARRLFAATSVSGFAFDVELFMAAERFGYEVVEVPVVVGDNTNSSVRPIRDGLRFVVDLVRVAAGRGRSSAPIDLSTDTSAWPGPPSRAERRGRSQRARSKRPHNQSTAG
jgi:glycosyltransferase involved in cell wall biosynthesis